MKKRITTGLAVAVLALPLWGGEPRYELGVDGLACPFCAYGIEKRLHKVDGVDAVEVDVGGGRVLVTMQEGASLTRERADRAVDQAGFTLRSFKPLESTEGVRGDDAHD